MADNKEIRLTWRDEDYGAASGAVAAFRATIEPYPSESAKVRVQRVYKKAGFELNHNRMSWISYKQDAAEALVSGLEALGFEITHCGCTPDQLMEPSSVVLTAPSQTPRV